MYQYFQLPNGIRIIHRQVASVVAHCAVFINVGSRDEDPNEYGMAHLIEHSIFKGTEKRKSHHILNRIDGVGGELNAYTTKEETCIYASFLSEHYDRALELFSDILFHSTFLEKEVEKEKDVILDEINSYKDSPSEFIYDEFEELVYRNHGLAHNILGEKQLLKKFKPNDIKRFMQKNYRTDRMIISSVGELDFKKVIRLCEKYFGDYPAQTTQETRTPFFDYQPVNLSKHRKTHQAHILLGNIAYSYNNPKRIPLTLLNNYLGGPAMNSRLNMGIREKYGFTYNLESQYNPFSDTGLFTIYAGVLFSAKDRTLDLILKELELLKSKKITEVQLNKAKKQLLGQMAISMDSTLNEMLAAGKSYLVYDKVETLDETSKQIMQITTDEIWEVANEIFDEKQLSYLFYVK